MFACRWNKHSRDVLSANRGAASDGEGVHDGDARHRVDAIGLYCFLGSVHGDMLHSLGLQPLAFDPFVQRIHPGHHRRGDIRAIMIIPASTRTG
jgi:hypothetical protein